MKEVSVRDLQRELRTVLDRVEKGEPVAITRRGRPVARLVPAKSSQVDPWPDLERRARSVLGRRLVDPPASRQLADDRGDT